MDGETSTATISDIDRDVERARLARMGKVSRIRHPFHGDVVRRRELRGARSCSRGRQGSCATSRSVGSRRCSRSRSRWCLSDLAGAEPQDQHGWARPTPTRWQAGPPPRVRDAPRQRARDGRGRAGGARRDPASPHGTLPEAPVELLLADNSHAHLARMVTASPTGEPPGCSVESPRPVPGGAPGPGAALPRQRGPRRLPEAAGPSARALLGGLRAGLDHGPHRRRHPRHRPSRGAASTRRGSKTSRRSPTWPATGSGCCGSWPRPSCRRRRTASPGCSTGAPSRTGCTALRSRGRRVRVGDGRPRSLQGPQRHLRPRDGRPGAAALRRGAARRAASRGHRVPLRRRRVRVVLPRVSDA